MTDRKEPPFYNDDRLGAFHYKLPVYDTMELFIETLTGTCFELRVLPYEAVVSVKAKIQRLEGIPVAQQHLIWNNLELDDEHTLHDYGIAEGCTLKLVLAMRGGPINTRRVTMEDPIKDVSDLMDSTKEENWEKTLNNKQVTFVVYREGEKYNFFRVVDRGDGTLTPLSESVSGGSVYNMYTEEEEGESSAAAQQSLENLITMNKMKQLKAKMEDMNLNKKPKKSIKVKPRPLVSPHSCSSSGPPGTRHHRRLFHSLPHNNQPWQANAHLPPIADHEPADSALPSAPVTSTHRPVSRPAPNLFPSSSCYMLQEKEQWETCPSFSKIRPPPKVSRLDIGSTRLMRDCVYPQLPPLCTRRPPDGFDPAKPVGETFGLSLLEESAGFVAPTQPVTPFGELPDPLSLDLSSQPEEGFQPFELGTHSPSPLSTWTLGPSETFTSRADRSQLGTSFYISPPSPSAAPRSTPTPTALLPQCFDASSLQTPTVEANACAPVRPGNMSPLPSTISHPPRLRGVRVESPGKRPELISKREARGITKMANQACKEPLGSLSNSELMASLAAGAVDGRSCRERDGESSERSQALHPAAVLGQSIAGSRLSSVSSHQTAAPYMNNLAPGGGATLFGRMGPAKYHLPSVKNLSGTKKKSSKHCFLCDKKTGLATSYECRCGHNFCATHRYAETHDCTFDYKSAGRRFLLETNPLISAPKLPKI
ncbi:AN1-type zinc finger protein 4 [Neosynchiropus ocellatus]